MTFGWPLHEARQRVQTRILAPLLVCILAGSAGSAGSQEEVSEAVLKAAIVANFFLFVEWPDVSGGLRLCVAGRGDTADAVLATEGRMIKDRAIETMRLATPEDVLGRRCKILFIPAGNERRAIEFARSASGSAILIVAEGDVLTIGQAHIVLTLDARRPVLNINLTEARRAGLDISSRLLRLARKVT
ncbi:MAG: YfiR family protein [Betaproteobacteria bacterium]